MRDNLFADSCIIYTNEVSRGWHYGLAIDVPRPRKSDSWSCTSREFMSKSIQGRSCYFATASYQSTAYNDTTASL